MEPAGATPQTARLLDNTPVAHANEILCDVETLNIDSASFHQIHEACGGDGARIADHVAAIVRERGKHHNPVTGSGGMFVGRVAEVGADLRGSIALRSGDRIASLVSLTLTPLYIEAIHRVDAATGRVWIKGKAILFESGIWAKLPEDIEQEVALAVLDVAGAPAQIRRMVKPGSTVIVLGAAGKSGILSCVQAKERAGARGRVIGIAAHAHTEGARLLIDGGYVDELIECDARDPLALSAAVCGSAPGIADLVVNCVNVHGTELASILCAKDEGTVYFFSMATSFTAAALGAEGVGKDVTMIIGNGYAKDHAAIALQTLRDHPAIHRYFSRKYAPSSLKV